MCSRLWETRFSSMVTIDRRNALDFVENFKKLEIELLKKKAELFGYEPLIRVHIMSEGGDIFAG